jgi:transcriptional regulator with XRE-family HTH domain
VDTSILRSARTARGLTRQAVAERTKLSPRLIAAIEDGRFDQLPAGFYARAYIRMYAHAVGLGDPSLIRPIVDAIPRVEVELENIVKCRETPVHRRGRNRPAVVVDAAVVAVLSAGGVLVCAALTGAGEWDLPEVSIAFLALAVPTLILYFGLLGATGVGTAGACLFRVEFVPGVNGPVDGTLLLRRTCEYFRSEAVALLGKPTRFARSLNRAASCRRTGCFDDRESQWTAVSQRSRISPTLARPSDA